MNYFILLFEISDKIMEVQMLYASFLIVGGIGLLLGFWRWWISAIWFVFPMLSFFVIFQLIETNYLYDAIIRELGSSYIRHSYVSMIIGVGLNIIGIFVRYFRPKKLNLE